MSDPILNSRKRRAEPRPEWFEPWPVVCLVDCQRALVPHELREPVAGFGRGLAVRDETGEVVG